MELAKELTKEMSEVVAAIIGWGKPPDNAINNIAHIIDKIIAEPVPNEKIEPPCKTCQGLGYLDPFNRIKCEVCNGNGSIL